MGVDRAPRVGIIIPTFNRAAFLSGAIKSALAQTYSDLEVLVVDDGSTDATGSVVREGYGHDPRVRYVRKENGGVASAQNEGIRLARGEYLSLLGDDDLYLPEKLALQVAMLDQHPEAALCFSDMMITGGPDNGRTFFETVHFDGAISMTALMRRNFIPASATLIRRSCLRTVGAFDETLRLAEDWDLWIRILAAHPVVRLDKVVSVYQRHDGPKLCDDRARLHEFAARMLRKNRGLHLWAGGHSIRYTWRKVLVERYARHHAAIGHAQRMKNLLRDPAVTRASVLASAARAMGEEPWSLKHYRRFLMIGAFGPRVMGRWYGGKRGHRHAVKDAPGALRATDMRL